MRAGRDLRGCIVLAEGIASPAVADRALRAGAAGQLHISPHEHLHEMCVSPVWGNPGLSTLAGLPATMACTVSNRDGSALRDRILQGDAPTVTLRAEVDTGWRPTPILQADLDGPDPGGPFILLSGHHDTWHYGVMDNGSANATMIECARVLAGQHAAWRRAGAGPVRSRGRHPRPQPPDARPSPGRPRTIVPLPESGRQQLYVAACSRAYAVGGRPTWRAKATLNVLAEL